MGPRLFFDNKENRWAIEYGIFPKFVEYFETKEDAQNAIPDILKKHVDSCFAFRYATGLLCEIGGRHLV